MTHVGVEMCLKDKLAPKEAEEYCQLCKRQLFTIGQVSRECHISKKALRFYEEIGVVIPDRICPVNGYRYYTRDTMNLIPVIKYYKQIGFKLQEMHGVQNNKTYFYHEQNFISKLDELTIEKEVFELCKTRFADRGVEFASMSVNVKFSNQIEEALDVISALNFYKAAGEEGLGRSVIQAKAGSANIQTVK